ncbi:MAG: hypothetical protein M3230_06260 [Thermoproteota archaeon]|nr:hypothetical protein [Thermoproteota archaeon]
MRRIVNILLSTVEPLIINAALGVQAPTVPKSSASRGCNYCGNNGGVACFMSIDSITAAKTEEEAPRIYILRIKFSILL